MANANQAIPIRTILYPDVRTGVITGAFPNRDDDLPWHHKAVAGPHDIASSELTDVERKELERAVAEAGGASKKNRSAAAAE